MTDDFRKVQLNQYWKWRKLIKEQRKSCIKINHPKVIKWVVNLSNERLNEEEVNVLNEFEFSSRVLDSFNRLWPLRVCTTVSGKSSPFTGSWKNHQIKIIYVCLIMQKLSVIKKNPTKTNKQSHNPKTWHIFKQEEYWSFQRVSYFIAIEVTGLDHAA